jgi:6-phosphogluconolactonase
VPRPDRLEVFDGPPALAEAVAHLFSRAAKDAVRERGIFRAALAGGSTPKATYALLGTPMWQARVPWDHTELFFGDERMVPPEHAESNYRMVREALLDYLPIPPRAVHRVATELGSGAAARAYEQTLAMAFGVEGPPAPAPRLDLVLLGLGTDGHTASLFPGSPALDEARRWAVVSSPAGGGLHRVTLTYPVLARAACVAFVVSGAEKATTLARVVAEPAGPRALPAGRVRPDGELVLLTDAAAASGLPASA